MCIRDSYPNKASNLNSYIALLDGSYRETPTPVGVLLTPTSPDHADFTIPAAEFILMLDADALIAPEYTIRLVDFLCQPGRETSPSCKAHTAHSPERRMCYFGLPGLKLIFNTCCISG